MMSEIFIFMPSFASLFVVLTYLFSSRSQVSRSAELALLCAAAPGVIFTFAWTYIFGFISIYIIYFVILLVPSTLSSAFAFLYALKFIYGPLAKNDIYLSKNKYLFFMILLCVSYSLDQVYALFLQSNLQNN